ncbi:MAG: Eco57I restriction-modification methylase domain-containing protein [Candidatus Thorarchaeota archaeon]
MVRVFNIEKLQSLWYSYCKTPNMEPNTWLPFINFLLCKTTLDFPYSYTDRYNADFVTLGEFDELIICYVKTDYSTKSLVKVCIEHLEALSSPKFILILNPSITGVNLVFFLTEIRESTEFVKIIHLPQGQMPTYFQEIIRTRSGQTINPIEILQELFDISKLEADLILSMKEKLRTRSNLRKQMIAYLILLLICSQLRINLSNLKKTTFQNFLTRILKFNGQQHINNDLLLKMRKVIKELRLNSLPIDIDIVQELLERYPYSLNEIRLFIQEVAITPSVFSDLTEIQTTSSAKKKEGKYYTSARNADFITHLAVYRLLSGRLSDIKSGDLLKSVYNDWGLMEDKSIKLSEDQLSRFPIIRVLDPACGTGTFLLSISRIFCRLISQSNYKKRYFPIIELYGIDPDKTAVLITRIRLFFFEMYELSRISFESLKNNKKFPIKWSFKCIIQGDFLNQTDINGKNYDLILGNPPWVRHEDIGVGRAPVYKDLIQSQIQKLTNVHYHFDRKSDLYIYFCLLGLSLLANGGILAFLTSNAWLEVKYGQTLQKFLLDPNNHIINFDIIHRRGKRLWNQLGINSIILIGEKSLKDSAEMHYGTFTETKIDFPQIPFHSLRKGLIPRNEYEDQYYRIEQIPKALLNKTHKWAGTFLRMSHLERNLIQHIRRKGVPLANLADVRFGIKTGANDFFHLQYLGKEGADEKVKVKNRLGYEGLIEKKYLVPLLKSPTHIKGFLVQRSFLPRLWLFYCLDSPSQLQGSGAWAYIKWGENASVVIKQGKKSGNNILGFSSVRSVKQREYWYSIGRYQIPTLLWAKSYHDKAGCFYNQAQIMPDQRFYGINIKQTKYIPLIFTFLNCSFVWAQMEAHGNTNMGYGVLDTNVYWLRDLKIPVNAMVELKKTKVLMDKLIHENSRISMLKFSTTIIEIDRFYAKYLDLSENDMKLLKGFITRSIKNRLQ